MTPSQEPTAEGGHAAPAPSDNSVSCVVETRNAESEGAAADRLGLKQDLLGALSGIQTSGSFALFGVLPRPPPAGIFVDGIGDIAMPLGESQTSQLIAKARQAPYGKGSTTIVDTAVRNTWKLDAEQFALRSSAWPGFLGALCTRVARDLGINSTITAKLYKMLIYERGAMFKAHTDTEKIPGMFGTLVICLPSAHLGGEVVVKHYGRKRVLRTSEAAQSFASWYSDVSHEVLPVTSGVRWVLTYNLALDLDAACPSAGLQRSETRALRHALRRWFAEDKASRQRHFVYHVLDHEYTEANVSLRALRARDLARVQALKEASAEFPLHIFLALLEKEESGSCEYDHWERRDYSRYYDCDEDDEEEEVDEPGYHNLEEVFKTRYGVKTLVDLDGRMVMQGLQLDQDDILQGVQRGPTATHWYRATAVAMVPCDWIVSFFNSGDPSQCHSSSRSSLALQIRYLARACLRPEAPEPSIIALVTLCEKAWAPQHDTSYGHGAQQPSVDAQGRRDVLKVAVQRGRHALFEQAALHHQGLLTLDFFAWMRQRLAIGHGDPDALFNAFQKGISSAVSSYPHFADQVRAISNLAPMPRDASTSGAVCTSRCVLDWARGMLSSCRACSPST
ncbi:2OG-Fe(II) oxygenase superfamily protein [Hirsutella rhossiliensis]|uniref:2OG-Fe(II) oxygenase superfamily domain-containing protein n=1 Tax=Hirsutella rhossiliensis TaxID=111463 RepID=A0A9P8MV10_9HYPO|nr:2OG-Fe(II) oxygenase superfamily domain-containing protein [Hirsutella rhossiliensis]KAH0961765.1 2OG-Fe(II) oxygenase superfamily domain-containing protein [Hirsutella rhossiliensis]